MIARIRGTIVERTGESIVVDVGGVGYLLSVPSSLAAELDVDQPVTLQVHTQVREDAIQLFGFADRAQRQAFEQLLTVNGVGARIALAVLGTLTVSELAAAVVQEDLRALQRVPGVGKRVAQRIVFDLAGKLLPEFVPVGLGQVAPVPKPKPQDPLPLALAQLGYRRSEIDQAQAWLAAQGHAEAPLPERIKLSLKHLSGG
jgi:Holliday junction DNA helicase RuvA